MKLSHLTLKQVETLGNAARKRWRPLSPRFGAAVNAVCVEELQLRRNLRLSAGALEVPSLGYDELPRLLASMSAFTCAIAETNFRNFTLDLMKALLVGAEKRPE